MVPENALFIANSLLSKYVELSNDHVKYVLLDKFIAKLNEFDKKAME